MPWLRIKGQRGLADDQLALIIITNDHRFFAGPIWTLVDVSLRFVILRCSWTCLLTYFKRLLLGISIVPKL